MNTHKSSKRRTVLLAAALVIVLAGLLAVRATPLSRPSSTVDAAKASVPRPAPILLEELPTPYCWGCSGNKHAPLEFQIDLDLLAPLGDGDANAAVWFKDFVKRGPRNAEWSDARTRVEVDGTPWLVLPANDALLLEAEHWVDQARCSFHPDVFEIDGVATELPNLLMMLDLARSWAARGKLAADPESAREDFRRAIRLGRLLRQDDVTLIQDLVAIACIRIGAEAMYELAREEGDAATMLATSLVLADKDAMRLSTMWRMSTFDRAIPVRDPATGELSLQITDESLDAVFELVRALEERRFRVEGVIVLQAVMHLGTESQRERARAVLDEFVEDPDELLATTARQLRDGPFDESAFP
ncbi:MAG: hypothetical protein GTN89_04550 [Acidobacteria bacterium]|nr:hypothetical protein [Acidobacteriota bacterium]NIM60415.1 hypothetical protein [Acidobacteriota bacterium]NIO58590.1 hypothetical protein [Acidobacteriota bacterium]NIQ29642.1 hypothetical protein [Acidobacteriota bacterium]NIQ84359.1 hypothetical protein [Acidobacteriota bacterium]